MIEDLKTPSYMRLIVVIAVILVAVLGLKYTSSIMSLLLAAIFMSLLIYPFLKWLERKGLSYNLAMVITLVGVLALGAGIIGFLVVALAQLIHQLPSMTINSNGFLAQYGNEIISFIVDNIPESDSEGIIATGTFMLFGVIFLVYELPQIKDRLVKEFGKDNSTLNQSFALVGTFIKYFLIRVKVNFIYGMGVTAVLLIFDINFALLWGFLTFFLGFIPYLGIVIAAIPPVLVAWAKYGIWGAIAMGIFFITINTIVESYIFPKLTGKGLQMSIFVVFAALFIWGWILGPVGFFIGVPLTFIVIKYLGNFDETRWLALLMTSDAEEEEEEEDKTQK